MSHLDLLIAFLNGCIETRQNEQVTFGDGSQGRDLEVDRRGGLKICRGNKEQRGIGLCYISLLTSRRVNNKGARGQGVAISR